MITNISGSNRKLYQQGTDLGLAFDGVWKKMEPFGNHICIMTSVSPLGTGALLDFFSHASHCATLEPFRPRGAEVRGCRSS